MWRNFMQTWATLDYDGRAIDRNLWIFVVKRIWIIVEKLFCIHPHFFIAACYVDWPGGGSAGGQLMWHIGGSRDSWEITSSAQLEGVLFGNSASHQTRAPPIRAQGNFVGNLISSSLSATVGTQPMSECSRYKSVFAYKTCGLQRQQWEDILFILKQLSTSFFLCYGHLWWATKENELSQFKFLAELHCEWTVFYRYKQMF